MANQKNKKKKNVKKKKTRRIRFGRIFLVVLILFLFFYLLSSIFKFPIKNIYIKGNELLSDQEIIEIAGIENYPSIFDISSHEMKKRLEKNVLIKSAKIEKKYLREVHITIQDNDPLYYDSDKKVTVLSNKKTIKKEWNVPFLMNYIPDTISDLFFEKMNSLDRTIIQRISEIQYDPNDVDEERFLLHMKDGNYVYLTLEKFEVIDGYVDIIKTFDNKKGILYLDSGEYFKIME